MAEECSVNIQWKNVHACLDFYCPCNPDFPQHVDGYSGQDFTCGTPDESDEDIDGWRASLTFCGRTWHLANQAYARPGPFLPDRNGATPEKYGCEDCATGHRTFDGR